MVKRQKITNKDIRKFLGHNGVECVVRIRRDGEIRRYGSSDPFNRSRDYWHYAGMVEDVANFIQAERDYAEDKKARNAVSVG